MEDANFCKLGEGEKRPRFLDWASILTTPISQRDEMAAVLRGAALCLEKGYLEGAARRMAEVGGYIVGKLAEIDGVDVEGVDFPAHNGGLLVQTKQGAVKTALYRHFDSDGLLLYVGISLSAVERLGGHMATSRWASKIARMDIEWFPSRELALEAEKRAIKAEKPQHNVVHNQ